MLHKRKLGYLCYAVPVDYDSSSPKSCLNNLAEVMTGGQVAHVFTCIPY